MHFDLTDLRLFVAVAETASITHGASRAHLALASASARIRGMEEALGVAVLERGRRGVTLTPAGRALLHHARLVLQQVERMRGELGDYARGLRGHVRLLSNTAALTEFLPEALAEFLTAHPNIDVDLEERPSDEIADALREGVADAGIVSDAVDLAGLETLPFRADRLVLAVPGGHPLARRKRLALREVVNRDFVGLSPGSALQDYLARHAQRLGRRLRLRVRLRGFDAICRMVEEGVGLAIIPESAAHRCRQVMAIEIVPLADPWALRQLTLCTRNLAELPAHARQLIAHLRGGALTPPSPRRA
ncbi:MAG TPA: LysR substrate-binding domain-containing protein [Stellaceae bacterium]|nr:LysR substrate-binding domain-containing protein [Stellaceae bacterium]